MNNKKKPVQLQVKPDPKSQKIPKFKEKQSEEEKNLEERKNLEEQKNLEDRKNLEEQKNLEEREKLEDFNLSESSDSDDVLEEIESPILGVTKKRTRNLDFSVHISRVKMQIAPSAKIDKQSMRVLDSFVHDFLERISLEARQMMEVAGRKVLRADDVLSAVKILLPGDLGTHTLSQMKTSLEKFDLAQSEKYNFSKK
jgi:histone H2B